VWSYDFVTSRTHDGRAFRILNILDEYTRERLDMTAERKITAHQVIERLAHLFIAKGIPEHIRSDDGPEFTAKAIRKWLEDLGVATLFIEPGSPRENGYVESLNGKLRDELLDGEIFTTLLEVKVLIGNWRRTYNTIRPHRSLRYKPPAPETVTPNNGCLVEGLTLKVVQ
jgi:putative transposase